MPANTTCWHTFKHDLVTLIERIAGRTNSCAGDVGADVDALLDRHSIIPGEPTNFRKRCLDSRLDHAHRLREDFAEHLEQHNGRRSRAIAALASAYACSISTIRRRFLKHGI